MSTEKRSLRVFSYSTRLSRRRTTRPWVARRAVSTAAVFASIQRISASTPSFGGRGLAFGGIAPVVICSFTVPQRSWPPFVDRVGSSWSTRNFPLVFSGPWHSWQCLTRNGRIDASKSGALPDGLSWLQPAVGRRHATMIRVALIARSSPRLGYSLFLVPGRVTREIRNSALLFTGGRAPAVGPSPPGLRRGRRVRARDCA